MTDHDLNQLYFDNEDFHTFVDKCREADGRTVEEELKLKTVQYVGEHYIERAKGRLE